jgi:hypothetical protein
LLELRGIGFSPDCGTTASEEMFGTSDRDGLLGVGHEVFIANLSPGQHQLELTVPDDLGGESVAMVTLEVTPTNSPDLYSSRP